MRLLKGFVIALLGLVIMITLLSLLIPSRVMVTRAVVINAPADKVMAQIKNLGHWKNWQPVFKSDSVKLIYNADSTNCQWETNGKMNQFISDSVTQNAVYLSLQRKGEADVKNILAILPLTDQIGVQVEWRTITYLKWYPWEKFYGIFIDKLAGPGYEDALKSLKAFVESH